MAHLNQILGVEQGVKARAERTLTDAYHTLQRADALAGIARTYRPKDDDGEQLPNESTLVQVRAAEVVDGVVDALARHFDVVATKDATNAVAKADVILEDGTVLLRDVPGVTLLFLEKQLVGLHTFVSKLPTLPPGSSWTRDDSTDTWVTEPTETTRPKKLPRNHVLAEATDKHPAQVQVYNEDVVVGYWTTRKFSGALPVARVRTLQRRVEEMQRAVRRAREQANLADVVDVEIGKVFLEHLFQ
jgi:hypothetical protein